MQLEKVVLDVNEEKKLVKRLKDKMSHKNFCMHLTLLKMFCCSSRDALISMDSRFLMISERDNFLQLSIDLLEEILSRSTLLVTSEIEVYQAANKWINYNLIERGKFSKRLLYKIRLPLLGKKTLETILSKKSCFRENKDSLAVINKILKSNFDFYRNKPSKFFTTRCCIHDSFDILYFGGYEKTTTDKTVGDKILQIKHSDNLKNFEIISSLAGKRYDSEVVYLRGNVYIFGGFDGRVFSDLLYRHILKQVEVYSHLTNTCKVVANIDDVNNDHFCSYALCGFVNKIYLLGGYDERNLELRSCIEFDTKDFSWKHKSKMTERREYPAACVFEEKIIVSGGINYRVDYFANLVNYYDKYDHQALYTVEAYDPISDTWTEFPTMNYSRCLHKSVVVKNKLFVIAGGTDINEVYESTSKKFTVLKPSFNLYDITTNEPFAVFSVGHKVFTYFEGSSNIFCFDTKKGEWFEKPSEATKQLTSFSAITAPRL